MIDILTSSRETKVQRERPVRRYCGSDSGLEVVSSREGGKKLCLWGMSERWCQRVYYLVRSGRKRRKEGIMRMLGLNNWSETVSTGDVEACSHHTTA